MKDRNWHLGRSNWALICSGEIKGNRAPVHKMSWFIFFSLFKARPLSAGTSKKQMGKSPAGLKFLPGNGEEGKVLALLPSKPCEAMQQLHLIRQACTPYTLSPNLPSGPTYGNVPQGSNEKRGTSQQEPTWQSPITRDGPLGVPDGIAPAGSRGFVRGMPHARQG